MGSVSVATCSQCFQKALTTFFTHVHVFLSRVLHLLTTHSHAHAFNTLPIHAYRVFGPFPENFVNPPPPEMRVSAYFWILKYILLRVNCFQTRPDIFVHFGPSNRIYQLVSRYSPPLAQIRTRVNSHPASDNVGLWANTRYGACLYNQISQPCYRHGM